MATVLMDRRARNTASQRSKRAWQSKEDREIANKRRRDARAGWRYVMLVISQGVRNELPCLRRNTKLVTNPGSKTMLPSLRSYARIIIKPDLQIVMLFSPSASVATIHLTQAQFCHAIASHS